MERLPASAREPRRIEMTRSRFVSPIRIGLAEGSLVTLPDDLEIEVLCESGALWITQLDSPNDIEAGPGDRRLIQHAKASIIVAVEAATLTLFVVSERQTRISLDFLLGRSALHCVPDRDARRLSGKGKLQLLKTRSSVAAQ
jgi:hypothetical protein